MKVFDGSVVVVIPLYKLSFTESEWFSFSNNLRVLGGHDISIVCPESIAEALRSAKSSWPRDVTVVPFPDVYFKGIRGYNRLLKSKLFYSTFDLYEYMLVAQTDALVFSDQLRYWCGRGYSYIGAPWFFGFSSPQKPLSFFCVGNGGLSLRRVPDFIKCFSGFRFVRSFSAPAPSGVFDWRGIFKWLKSYRCCGFNRGFFTPGVNEDFYWGVLMPQVFEFFVVPSPREAVAFSFEVEPRVLYELNGEKLPFACHAWEKYDFQFWDQVLREHGIFIPKKILEDDI